MHFAFNVAQSVAAGAFGKCCILQQKESKRPHNLKTKYLDAGPHGLLRIAKGKNKISLNKILSLLSVICQTVQYLRTIWFGSSILLMGKTKTTELHYV